jgi:hypothetical protein
MIHLAQFLDPPADAGWARAEKRRFGRGVNTSNFSNAYVGGLDGLTATATEVDREVEDLV